MRESEKRLSQNIYERGVDDAGFGRIRSKGDTALFGGKSTQDMKNKLGVKDNRPLADFLPTLTIAAKNLATEMTNYNVEEKGLLKRTHGGALPLRQIAIGRPAKMTIKDMNSVRENYLEIAKKAVSMIRNNDVIYIPSATVGLFMVQNLPDNLKIRVVTNSIVIAEELRKKDNISVIMLGGEMDDRGNCYDTIAVETIKRLRFDKCFITSACISASFGLSIQKTQAISFWNALIDSSKMTVGLYPKEKIGFDSIISICPANRLDTLITDWDASEEDLKLFDEQEIEVVVVDKPE